MKRIFSIFFLIINVENLVFSLDDNEARELLMAKEGGNIQYLSKINLGIPGGDNWIASRNDRNVYVYTVNRDKEVNRIDRYDYTELSEIKYFDPNIRDYVDLEFDIMQHIPGTQIGGKAAKFWDYNGDGIDEIFVLENGFELNELRCYILRYDNRTREFIYPFSCSSYISGSKLPIPVGFYNYMGIVGIMVHGWEFSENRHIWRFFACNEFGYAIIENDLREDEIDYSKYMLFQRPETREYQFNNELSTGKSVVVTTENEQAESTILPTVEDGGKSGLFIIALSISVVVVAVAIVFLAVRKKRKI